jgi:hypothetical protein
LAQVVFAEQQFVDRHVSQAGVSPMFNMPNPPGPPSTIPPALQKFQVDSWVAQAV